MSEDSLTPTTREREEANRIFVSTSRRQQIWLPRHYSRTREAGVNRFFSFSFLHFLNIFKSIYFIFNKKNNQILHKNQLYQPLNPGGSIFYFMISVSERI
jgi:hypothetical protein